MINIKEQADIILSDWYTKTHYYNHNQYCTNHKELKKFLGNFFFYDKELVLEINKQAQRFIIQNNIKLVDFLSDDLKNDKELIIALLKTNGYNLSILKDELKDSEEIVLAALESTTEIFSFVSERLRDNDRIVKLVLEKAPKNILYASDRFRNNKDLVSKLLKKNESLLKDVHDDLKNDIDTLFLVWETIKEKTKENKVHFNHKSEVFLKSMGEKMKPYFNHQLSDNRKKEIDSVFEHFFLTRELSSNNTNQSKKLKL